MSSLGRTVTRKQLPIFHQLGVKFLISSLVTLSGFASVVGAGTLRRGPSDKETTRRRGGPGRRWIPAPAPQSSYCSHVVHRVPWSWVVFCYRSHTRRWLLQARCSTKGPRDHDHDLPRQPGMCTVRCDIRRCGLGFYQGKLYVLSSCLPKPLNCFCTSSVDVMWLGHRDRTKLAGSKAP
jgi:hypothetical protein